MVRSLADGHTRFAILVTAPADPGNPTAGELNAGIDASDRILASDFNFGPADSDKVAEKSLASASNTNALGASNYTAAFSPFRYFDAVTGDPDPTGDVVHAATRVKGTELWCYARRDGKMASVPWTSGDEVFFGAHVLTDSPQPPGDLGGYIKTRVPCEVQEGWEYTEAV